MTTWREVRSELNLTDEDENIIEIEKELIKAMVKLREQEGLSQSQLAQKCHMKQPVIARMEKAVHSPQIDSLLRILVSLGYKLQIVPMEKKS